LRNWASDLLADARRSKDGIIDMVRVEAWWRDHLAGTLDRSRELWSVLMFQAWANENKQFSAPAHVKHRTIELSGA